MVTLFVAALVLAGSATRVSRADESRAELGGRATLPAVAGALQGTVLADVAEASVAGVVNIASEKRTKGPDMEIGPFQNDPFFRQFFHNFGPQVPQERLERSLGSGVIVTDDGTILTNNHVVEGAEDVRVTLSDGREFEAKILGTDPQTDLAVLKLEGGPDDLKPLRFGDSSKLRLGEVVLAIGDPFGVGQTVTMGIVSAKGRADVGIVDYEDFIQTDAAINPGNSGGALVNTRGELVGINTAILSRSGGYQGIGFAIPTGMIRPVMESLIERGKVSRGWLGVSIQDVTQDLADALGLEDVTGILVSEVLQGSPAEKAGLEAQDVIVALDGKPVATKGELRTRIASAGPGVDIDLTVIRGGKKRDIEVELGELEPQVARGPEAPSGPLGGGLELAPLDRAVRQQFQVPDAVSRGVVVTGVTPGSPAARAGLRIGDVIEQINREPVESVQKFRSVYEASSKTVLLLVRRQGATIFVPLRKQ